MGTPKMRFLPLLLLSSLSLSGCSLIESWEKSLTVDCYYGNEVYYSSDVTIFNNAILPALPGSDIPDGFSFLGWALPGWVFGSSSIDDLYKANSVLHYNEVLPYSNDGKVSLDAIVIDNADLPERYFVLGWYAKTSTSGLNQDRIDRFTPALHDYLESQGASAEELADIAIRGYSGDVATMGASINADGDVDVLLGVGNNINSTAGVEIIEKVGNIMCGGKSRYIARLTDKPVSVLVYQWLQTEDAQSYLV